MLATVLILETSTTTDIYVIPEANVGDDEVAALKLAAGHYVSPNVTNPPPIAEALNTVLELVAGEWGRYKIAGGVLEDKDYAIVRVVVTGYL